MDAPLYIRRPVCNSPLDPALSLSGACQEDVAASTSERQAGLSQARRLADARPKLSGRRTQLAAVKLSVGEYIVVCP